MTHHHTWTKISADSLSKFGESVWACECGEIRKDEAGGSKMNRVIFVYYGMMVSFRVEDADLEKFLEIIKENGAASVEAERV